MSNLPIPEISPAFPVADIADDINSGAREFMALIENAKLAKKQVGAT